jgi:hypothetical protein
VLRNVVVSVAALVLAVSATASAAPSDVQTADVLFREARAAAKKGDYATACPKFRESYRLDSAVGTLLNVGDCDEHEGHILAAIGRFEDAEKRLAPSDDRVTYVHSRINALSARVAKVTGDPGNLQVFIDGTEAKDRPLAVRIDPGSHSIRIVGDDRDDTFALPLKDGETRVVDFTPAPKPAQKPFPFTPPASKTPAYVVGAVGIAGLIATSAFVGLMYHEKSTADKNCQREICNQDGIDATSRGKRDGFIAGTTFTVSLAAIGVATWLFVRKGPANEKPIAIGDYVLGGAL